MLAVARLVPTSAFLSEFETSLRIPIARNIFQKAGQSSFFHNGIEANFVS